MDVAWPFPPTNSTELIKPFQKIHRMNWRQAKSKANSLYHKYISFTYPALQDPESMLTGRETLVSDTSKKNVYLAEVNLQTFGVCAYECVRVLLCAVGEVWCNYFPVCFLFPCLHCVWALLHCVLPSKWALGLKSRHFSVYCAIY